MTPDSVLSEIFRLDERQKRALLKLGLHSVEKLLRHFPARYESVADIKHIADLRPGDTAVVYGIISGLKTRKAFRRRTPIAEGVLGDGTGNIKIMWFNQPYLAKMLHEGSVVKVAGKVAGKDGKLYIGNPETSEEASVPLASASLFTEKNDIAGLYPVYPESRGITSKWFSYNIGKVLKAGLLETLTDPLPEELLKRYNLPALRTALVWIHAPQKLSDSVAARKRFAFEEVFLIQVAKQQARRAYAHEPTISISVNNDGLKNFVARFPFEPTEAQARAIQTILGDFEKPHAMSRLLEGDVGSGKTAVAAATAYTTVVSRPKGQNFGNLQVAYMAPTEILAKQHFESFITYFEHLPIAIGLITGSGCKKFPSKVSPDRATDISRAQLLKWVANGEIPILIGTHALIQKSVRFKHLAYVIIDEQHRFGVSQRAALAKKEHLLPHLLSMTATPIPRTLALTIYGDLDLTLLDEMPEGRKTIITEIVLPGARPATYEKIRTELRAGRQAYVICPRINEPDPTKELALLAKSVKAEAARLKKEIFPEYEIDILHSKLSTKEKDRVMEAFVGGKTRILVATSVVEVGVNVQNATVIVIEGAERFGLSQLHQLRGRVIRSNHQAYCFCFSETRGTTSVERLKALKTAKNGFELAELDLKLRGVGELYGRRQWGLSDIAMEAMQNLKMVAAARTEAHALIEKDPELKKHTLIATLVKERSAELHFE